MSEPLLLNDGPVPETTPELDVAARLRRDINRLKAEFYDLERGRVDYDAMRQSEAYRRYVADTALLRDFYLGRLGSREEQLAFWVNIYNTLVIHGVIALGIRESVKEAPHFFTRIRYAIGGMTFSPDEIEHGILRGNHRPPHGLFHPFAAGDQKRGWAVDPPDPRIHFTLVCASSSCPPINFYTPEGIEAQLDAAAAGFINGPEVEIFPRQSRLRLSPIFKWYGADFGDHEGVIDTLIRYRDLGADKDFLIMRGLAAEVEWKEYDWRLNR
jgi:hypothetical protein